MREPNEDYRNKTYFCSSCRVNIVAAPKIDEPVNELHGYKLYCIDCGKFVAWSGYKKEIVKNGERQFASQWSAKRAGIDYCQICLRRRSSLGRSETIETHHIVQVSDGGEDGLSNLMFLCTACHALVHHQRTYLNNHLRRQTKAYEAVQIAKHSNPEIYAKIIEIYNESRGGNGK